MSDATANSAAPGASCHNASQQPSAAADADTPAITARRSSRSASMPTGYCVSTPARMLPAMNTAIAASSMPLSRA